MKPIKFIVFFILCSAIVFAQQNKIYYSLTLEYTKGEILKKDMFLIESPEQDYKNQPGEGYSLILKSFKEEELFSMKFNFPLKKINDAPVDWFDKEGQQIIVPTVTEKELDRASIALSVPYFKNGKTIEIYDKSNKLKLSIDVSEFSTCNFNKICDLKESHELCPEDCPFQEGKIKLSLWQRIIKFINNIFK